MSHDPNKIPPTAPPLPTKPDGFHPFTPLVDPAAIALRTLDALNTTTATLRDLHAENARLRHRADNLTDDLGQVERTAHEQQRAADARVNRLEQSVIVAIAAVDLDFSDDHGLIPKDAIEALRAALDQSQARADAHHALDLTVHEPVPGLTRRDVA